MHHDTRTGMSQELRFHCNSWDPPRKWITNYMSAKFSKPYLQSPRNPRITPNWCQWPPIEHHDQNSKAMLQWPHDGLRAATCMCSDRPGRRGTSNSKALPRKSQYVQNKISKHSMRKARQSQHIIQTCSHLHWSQIKWIMIHHLLNQTTNRAEMPNYKSQCESRP